MSTDLALTKASVSAALARPLEQRDGLWRCQVCDRGFKSRQAFGPHQLQHRRALGLAPARRENIARGVLTGAIICAVDGCTSRLQRPSYARHLRHVHHLTAEAAYRVIKDHAADEYARRSGALVPAVAEEEPAPEHEPESVLTDLTAVEAATGILSAARRDGLVPVVMLRSVVDWIGHTQQVLDELAHYSAAP